MNLRPLLLTLVSLALLGAVLPKADCCAGADEPSAVQEGARPLRFRRVYAPADRTKDWPLGKVKYMRMEPAEFERLLKIAQRATSANRSLLAARTQTAQYHARLAGDRLTAGQASLQVSHSAETPALLSLDPCKLAIGEAVWSGEDPKPATLGLGVEGKLQVLVESSGELSFPWSMTGRRDADDVLSFPIELPACPTNSLILDLPVDVMPAVEYGLVFAAGWVDEELRRWHIELGGRHRFLLRLLPYGADRQQPESSLVRQSVEYHFSPRGLDVVAELKFEVHNGPLRQVALTLDRELELIGAQYGDQSVPWSVTSAADSPTVRIALALPESMHDTQRVLRLRALAPLTVDRRWRLPGIRPEGVLWQEGVAGLFVPDPLLLEQLDPIGCRQTGTGPLSGSRNGESAQFQCFQPDATVEVVLSRRRVPLQLSSGTTIELSNRGMSARIVADFRVAEDPRFSLQAEISRRWLIDSVESFPPEALDDWDPGKPSGRPRNLTVRLAKSLAPTRPVRLVVHARRPLSPLGRDFAVDDLVPLRFLAPPQSKRLVAVRATGPYELQLSGTEQLHRVDPIHLAPAELELLGEMPGDLLFENDSGAAELRVSLEDQTTEDVVSPPETAVPVPGSTNRTTPPVWVWDCRLESRYEANGKGRHRASYRLQSSGGGSLRLDLPPGVNSEGVHGVWVHGGRVALHRLEGDRAGRLTIDLPPDEKFPTVSILFSTPQVHLGTIGSLGAPLPEVNLSVLAGDWTVWLPPGYEAYGSKVDWSSSQTPRLSWSRRLFGPLGRALGEGAPNPLIEIPRLFSSISTRNRPPASVVPPPRPPAEEGEPRIHAPREGGEPAANHGWNTYRLRISATSGAHSADRENAPPMEGLKFVHRQTLRLLGLVTFLTVIALGWWTVGDRPDVLILLAGGFGAATLLLPEVYVPLASGAVLGTLFCLGYRLIRKPGNARRTAPDSIVQADPPRPVSEATPAGVLLLVAIAVGAASAAALGEQPGPAPPAPPAHQVFIPVDQGQQPTGEKYYVPEEIYNHLHRRATVQTEKPHGRLITTASYRGVLSRETTSQRLVLEELKADFTLEVFDAAKRVQIPLGREGANLLPDGALLDSRVIQPEWEVDGSGLLLEVPRPGKYHLELSLRPTLRTDVAETGFDLNIPPLAASRLELSVPPGTSAIRVPSAVGEIHLEEDLSRMIAELGPSDRLSVRWPGGGGRAATGSARPFGGTSKMPHPWDVEELLWMKVQPGSVVIDAKFKFKVVQGQARQARLITDPRLRLHPLEGDDLPSVEVGGKPGQSQTLLFQWPEPVSDRVVLGARFILTGTSGVGNLRLPQLKALDARSTRRWLAVSVDPALQHEEHPSDGREAVAVPDFLGSWGQAESQPLFVDRLTAGENAWSMSTQLCEPRTTVDQKLALSFDREYAAVQFDAQLAPAAGYIFQHRLKAPAALQVEDVTVLEDGARRSARWSQDAKGTITVFLTELMAGPQQLSLRGRLPTRVKKMQLPVLQIDASQLQSSTIELFRRPAVQVELDKTEGLVEVDDPAADDDDPQRGRLVGRFRLQPDARAGATLTLTPNRPEIRAEQVTWLRCGGGSWTAEIDCRIHASDGLVDEIRIDLPDALGGPYQISPPAALRVMDTPDERRQLIVRPPVAIAADYPFSVSSPLTFNPGDRPSAPQVSLRGADRLKRFLVLPNEADGQPIDWKKQGLKETTMPGGFAPPPDVESLSAHEIVSKDFQAILSRDRSRQDARVRLADVRIAWQADRSCVGVATFDLEPGRLSECRLWLPAEYRLLQVSVAGTPSEPLPVEPVSTAIKAWRVPLGTARLPQQIEVLFSGESSERVSGAEQTFNAPTLGRLPVEQTLWTVAAPPRLVPGQPQGTTPASPWNHEMFRLASAAALIESASTVPADDPDETLRWYRRWAGRLVAARNTLQRRPAQGGPDTKALEEIDAIDARQSQIAQRLGMADVYQRLKRDGPPAADDSARLWQASHDPGQVAVRCTVPRRCESITLDYRPRQTTSSAYRLIGSFGLLAMSVLAVALFRGGAPEEWFKRWPQAIGVAAGLVWWLWLSPSILGWGIVLVSLATALLSGWKYSPPVPGSSVISLRTRRR